MAASEAVGEDLRADLSLRLGGALGDVDPSSLDLALLVLESESDRLRYPEATASPTAEVEEAAPSSLKAADSGTEPESLRCLLELDLA